MKLESLETEKENDGRYASLGRCAVRWASANDGLGEITRLEGQLAALTAQRNKKS
jgi:hypothetical protein